MGNLVFYKVLLHALIHLSIAKHVFKHKEKINSVHAIVIVIDGVMYFITAARYSIEAAIFKTATL